MTRQRFGIFSLIFVLAICSLATSGAFAQSVEMRLPDGSRWRGEIGDQVRMTILERRVEVEIEGRIIAAADLYLQLQGDFLGAETRTVFKSDIRSIETIRREDDSPRERTEPSRDERDGDPKDKANDDGPAVLYLPLRGGVGTEIRETEIKKIGEEADRLGPGQIIVLRVDTDGGLIFETVKIVRTLREIKERHRVVAWVNHRAYSAGVAIASVCHEIYFSEDGAAGALTPHAGGQAIGDEEVERWYRLMREWFQEGGRPGFLADAMIVVDREVSYDVDSETGRTRWYPNLSGQHILSRKGDNLTITAHHAVQSGFAAGLANTLEELAKQLDMPQWREVNDYGRRIHEEWMSTIGRARDQIPRLLVELNRGATLQRQAAIYRELISWCNRAPEVIRETVGAMAEDAKVEFERREREIRFQIAEQRRRSR